MVRWRFGTLLAALLVLSACETLPTMVSGPVPSRMPQNAGAQPPVVVGPVALDASGSPVASDPDRRFPTAQEFEAKLNEIATAIAGLRATTDGQPRSVVASIDQLAGQTQALVEQLKAANSNSKTLLDNIPGLQTEIVRLKDAVSDLQRRLSDIEKAPPPNVPQAPNLEPLQKELQTLKQNLEALQNTVKDIDTRVGNLESQQLRLARTDCDRDKGECPVTLNELRGKLSDVLRRINEVEAAAIARHNELLKLPRLAIWSGGGANGESAPKWAITAEALSKIEFIINSLSIIVFTLFVLVVFAIVQVFRIGIANPKAIKTILSVFYGAAGTIAGLGLTFVVIAAVGSPGAPALPGGSDTPPHASGLVEWSASLATVLFFVAFFVSMVATKFRWDRFAAAESRDIEALKRHIGELQKDGNLPDALSDISKTAITPTGEHSAETLRTILSELMRRSESKGSSPK